MRDRRRSYEQSNSRTHRPRSATILGSRAWGPISTCSSSQSEAEGGAAKQDLSDGSSLASQVTVSPSNMKEK